VKARPIQVPAQVSDVLTVGTSNALGVSGTQTGSYPTDETWPDEYFVCSPACPGSTGQADAGQTWTWNALPLLHVNYVVYKCGSITIDGKWP